MEPLMRRLGGLPVREFLAEPEHLADTFFDIYAEAGRKRPRCARRCSAAGKSDGRPVGAPPVIRSLTRRGSRTARVNP
jgi:hypothetical protein